MEGRVFQTAEFVKIRLNGFLCRALIGPNLPGLPPRNIVLASLETTKWFAQVTQMTKPPHQGPAPLERGPELFERGAQRGASSTEEPQPA